MGGLLADPTSAICMTDSVIFQLVRAALKDQPINLPNINDSRAPSRRDPCAHGGHVMDRKIHPVNTHTSLKLMGNSIFAHFPKKPESRTGEPPFPCRITLSGHPDLPFTKSIVGHYYHSPDQSLPTNPLCLNHL